MSQISRCGPLVDNAKNATHDAVAKLVSGYPSHDFIIDAQEARTLFTTVSALTKAMHDLVRKIGRAAYIEQDQHLVYRADLLPVPSSAEVESDEQTSETANPPAGTDSAGLDAARRPSRSGNGAGTPDRRRKSRAEKAPTDKGAGKPK